MNTEKEISSWLRRRHDSAARAWAVLDWAAGLQVDDDGPLFWEVVIANWSGFDRIPHFEYADVFSTFSGSWRETNELSTLPNQFTLYRGQPTDGAPGLSWTLDLAVAQAFARGHRGARNPDPTILIATVDRDEVVLYLTDREEHEIVLWEAPSKCGIYSG